MLHGQTRCEETETGGAVRIAKAGDKGLPQRAESSADQRGNRIELPCGMTDRQTLLWK